ncbi:hypothetical protein U1Q18_003278 [Sarracenia purpurea var. burkii]
MKKQVISQAPSGACEEIRKEDAISENNRAQQNIESPLAQSGTKLGVEAVHHNDKLEYFSKTNKEENGVTNEDEEEGLGSESGEFETESDEEKSASDVNEQSEVKLEILNKDLKEEDSQGIIEKLK